MTRLTTIGFDGDDTLWHCERAFQLSQERFAGLLAPWVEGEAALDRLLAVEKRNLAVFGYGIKGFVLSMIETALELTDRRIDGERIETLIGLGRAMMAEPVELLPGVDEAIDALAGRYRLVLVTKGDLFDQEGKIARSGLGERFDGIEIVSEKDAAAYRGVLARQGAAAEEFLMIGNSPRSDVEPVVAIGGRAVHVPYHITWALEEAHPDAAEAIGASGRAWRVDSLADVPTLVERLA